MQRLSVLLPRPFDTPFDYTVPEDMSLTVGDYVLVPFGKSELVGVIWGEALGEVAAEKCKPISTTYHHIPPMKEEMRQFIDWVAWYTLAPKGMVLKMALSVPDALRAPKQITRLFISADIKNNAEEKLSPKRAQVLEALQIHGPLMQAELVKEAGVGASVVRAMKQAGLLEARETKSMVHQQVFEGYKRTLLSAQQQKIATQLRQKIAQGFSVSLIDGVTGSGKTEVYFDTMEKILEKNEGQILVLLPEISLSIQWLERCKQRFGCEPTLWHSSVSAAKRRDNWQAIATGKSRLIVGARSALFLPFSNLQMVVVDEEHDGSYKQEEGVFYHARDMAIVRAKLEQIPVILASATPSLETRVNQQEGRYITHHLPSRFAEATLPKSTVIDMREETLDAQHWVSAPLKTALTNTLANGHQAMLFLNRRGYAPLVLCRSCGHRFECPNCTAWMVLHSNPPRLHCHHCDFRMPIPSHCPECGAKDTLTACGPGVERVREEVEVLFPQARVASLSSDQADMADILKAMQAGKLDILIGTQVIAKGHHFARLALVGVVDADIGLQGGDLRACERTYQLLHQVSGRAGREQIAGQVLIQTYQPQHPVVQALARADRDGLMQLEMQQRKSAAMPPYGRLAAVIIEGEKEAQVREICSVLARAIPAIEGVRVLGPAPAPLARIKRHYRYRFLLHGQKQTNIQQILRDWTWQVKPPSGIKIKVDVDPYSFV